MMQEPTRGGEGRGGGMGTHLEKGIPKNQPEGKTNSPEKFFALGGPVAQSAQGYEEVRHASRLVSSRTSTQLPKVQPKKSWFSVGLGFGLNLGSLWSSRQIPLRDRWSGPLPKKEGRLGLRYSPRTVGRARLVKKGQPSLFEIQERSPLEEEKRHH